jgi:hypothetical protein
MQQTMLQTYCLHAGLFSDATNMLQTILRVTRDFFGRHQYVAKELQICCKYVAGPNRSKYVAKELQICCKYAAKELQICCVCLGML